MICMQPHDCGSILTSVRVGGKERLTALRWFAGPGPDAGMGGKLSFGCGVPGQKLQLFG